MKRLFVITCSSTHAYYQQTALSFKNTVHTIEFSVFKSFYYNIFDHITDFPIIQLLGFSKPFNMTVAYDQISNMHGCSVVNLLKKTCFNKFFVAQCNYVTPVYAHYRGVMSRYKRHTTKMTPMPHDVTIPEIDTDRHNSLKNTTYLIFHGFIKIIKIRVSYNFFFLLWAYTIFESQKKTLFRH